MKKAIFTLAIFMMAFGTIGFAQSKTEWKAFEKKNVHKHHGLRNESIIKPLEANWTTSENELFRTTYTYDEYEYWLTEEVVKVNFGGGWMPFAKLTYDYDFSGELLEINAYEYENNDWVESERAVYAYGEDEMEIVYQYMDNGAWVNDFREVYNYNGDVTTILLWDWNGNNWTSDELYTYTHSTGSIELLIQYMQGGAWQNDEKQRFTLDFDENVTEILVQDWQNNTWVNDEKTTYHYEGGVYTSMLVEEWSNGVWNEEYKYNFTYVDGNATHGECLEYVGNQWVAANGDMEMAYNYNEGKNTYYGVEVDVVYFDVTSVGENAQVTDVIVYPNPANEVLTIQADDFQKVEMYSLTGQKVLESTSSTLNVGELQSGVYLLKVYGLAGRIATQHIVVK